MSAIRAEPERVDYDRVLAHRHLMEEFAAMVNLTESNPREIELAAFLIRDSEDRLSLVRWPSTQRERTQVWVGPMPDGVIATVHTHPNGWRKPSSEDHREATRSGLPFLVLTRWDIWVAEPGARQSKRLLWNEDWRARSYLAALRTEEDERETTVIAGGSGQPKPTWRAKTAEPSGLR